MLTREEALSTEVVYLTCDDELILSNLPVQNVSELINDIYDDFESRVCENCRYYGHNMPIVDQDNIAENSLDFCTYHGEHRHCSLYGCNSFATTLYKGI